MREFELHSGRSPLCAAGRLPANDSQFDLFGDEPADDVEPLLVAVVDDDAGARGSLAWFLEGEGYRVIPFASGDAFLDAGPPPDLACVLLDLRMPGRSGMDVLRELAKRGDAPPALILSGQGDVPTAVEAMRLKAIDFLEKPYKPEQLLQALAGATAQGERARESRNARRQACALIDGLTARQRQVLGALVRGAPNKVVAFELGLSIRTVEAYRAQLFTRLGARSTAGAVRIALAAGLDGAPAASARPRRALSRR